MTLEEYKVLQRDNISRALENGRELLRVSANLHEAYDTAGARAATDDGGKDYLRDSLMYFDFNDAVTNISGMPYSLKDFLQQLIDIKIANDRMLLDGGFISGIDQGIARIFIAHSLGNVRIINRDVINAVTEAVQMLEDLQKVL